MKLVRLFSQNNPTYRSIFNQISEEFRNQRKAFSIYSFINKIFQDSKEPLLDRADRIFYLKPFFIPDINRIMRDIFAPSGKHDRIGSC